ncbi:sigma-54-dependent transcriptional regulator [Spiribacter vilamensis]|uniref:DNA-binding NtrC family response regulator n=1 Tax=Spiribacter vilamensis TaxID=531306 RepID=A0A4Q8D0G6_9GAMM|nr:sigma-54 dependent transcriptional regulator [Spiribacter vilamensis]RZU98764.1 DNA-binding NtrC family response regulator [Spiribacter vilamensis]TVO62214.1 sigma-54-dependent Fis family transcriptional regulator [Spiribacter vilamensis]
MSDPTIATILVVEDDRSLRALLRDELEGLGHTVVTAAGEAEARAALHEHRPALVVSDLRLPDGDGIQLLEHVRHAGGGREIGFIVITGFGTIEQAVDALKKDADDFLTKPLDLDHLGLSVGRVLENIRLRRRLSGYEALHGREGFHGMVGQSAPMQQLYRSIERIAVTESPVLIHGESGTGKELVAAAVHAESNRAGKPFIAVNCAGVPADLLESEFFGHVRGAFTGADSTRRGLLQAADTGTLFLDEIGEMPLPLQAKLLRVLEDGSLRPVGADTEFKVDVRIVAATNRDLEQRVADGAFREDLFYRIDTFTVTVPPLRQRGEDIDRLAVGFLAAAARRQGREPPALSPEAHAELAAHDWPGNVRELANAMERALAFAGDQQIDATDLPARVGRTPGAATPTRGEDDRSLATLADVEASHIRHVLDAVGGNRRRAADILGIGRRTLYRKLDSSQSGGL